MKKVFQFLTIVFCCTVFAGSDYSFYLISDTHFGSLESFGENPTAKLRRKGVRAKTAVPLLDAMFKQMAERYGKKNAFLIHTGDVIEGNAFSKEAHIRQFVEAESMLKKYFNCPVYMVRGNHESVGKYGKAAYFEYIAPAIAKFAGKPEKTVHYTVKRGDDVFIFVDAYTKGWQNFIYRTLDALEKRPRYLFLVLHPDLLPHAQKHIVNLCSRLGDFNAVILSGHTHRTRLLKYTRNGKTTTQFSIGSHLTAPAGKMKYTQKSTDLNDFLVPFRKLRVKRASQIELFDREIVPFLSDYVEYHDGSNRFLAQGYAVLEVTDSGVTAKIHSGDLSSEPFEIILLKRNISGENEK